MIKRRVYNFGGPGFKPREGVIIEWPLNDLFHDPCDVLLTSRKAVSNTFLTVAVI